MSLTNTQPAPAGQRPRRRPLHRLARAVAIVLTPVLAVTAGVEALFQTARLTTRPGAFLAAGFLAYLLVGLSGLWLLTRHAPTRTRTRGRLAGSAVVALVVLLPALTWLLPPPATPPPAPPLPGMVFWNLPTGSRIAALRVPAAGQPKASPIVFLHGGPGVSDMEHDSAYFGRFAAEGHDVWLYDQIGNGFSGRLADPTGYSLRRDVADLEAVRQQIGADAMILIGHSYGGTLAANYLASHPDRVEKVVFSTPGRLAPEADDVSGTGMVGRLDSAHMAKVARQLLSPRAYLAWALAAETPRSAHAFAGDREMDVRFGKLTRAAAPGLVCPASAPPPVPEALGFYANRVPLARTQDERDIRPALRKVTVPVLVLKGSCDYLPWHFATDVRAALPQATLIYLDGTGHQMYEEQPGRYAEIVKAFVAGRTLPESTYSSDAAPANFEGPTP